MTNVKALVLLALEYLAESSDEVAYSLVRSVLDGALVLEPDAKEQFLGLFAFGEDGAVDREALREDLRGFARAYAAVNGLLPMLIAPDAAIPDRFADSVRRADATRATISRCADYAKRAAAGTSEQKTAALTRLADELQAVLPPVPAAPAQP